MICLGIEGTAHTFGVGIVDSEARVLANKASMYRPEEGGIHPREAANHHAAKAVEVMRRAMGEARLGYEDIGLVAFSQGPGLGPCLRTAATTARALSLSLDRPMVGVNHCIAHLEIGRATTDCRDPVLLYVSGGNTQVIAFARGRYRVFGETLDIGIGNMLDKFGRERGMPFPAGKRMEELALEGEELVDLPYSVKGMDVSFSGILTAALNATGHRLEDLCHSIQEHSFAMLVEVTERAMAHTEKEELLLGGGVARNMRLQSMCSTMTEERGAGFYVPAPELCVDNGAMIAWTGIKMHEAGITTPVRESVVSQRSRTDEVEAIWH